MPLFIDLLSHTQYDPLIINRNVEGIRPFLLERARGANEHGVPRTRVLTDIAMIVCTSCTLQKMSWLFFSSEKNNMTRNITSHLSSIETLSAHLCALACSSALKKKLHTTSPHTSQASKHPLRTSALLLVPPR